MFTKLIQKNIASVIMSPYNSSYKPAKLLPLYNSSVFTNAGQNFDDIWVNKAAKLRYAQLQAAYLLEAVDIGIHKFLYTKMEFDQQNEMIRIVLLRLDTYQTINLHKKHLVPWSYRDMIASSLIGELQLPPFVDEVMIYFSPIQKYHLFAENDGVWNKQTVNHPKLSLANSADERSWMDDNKIV